VKIAIGVVQDVSGLNDHAPSGPDEACAGNGEVLGQGELFGWAVEVGYSC